MSSSSVSSQVPKPNLIAGQWRAQGAESIHNINPSDLSDTVGEYVAASPADVADAIAAAGAAFPAWSRGPLQARAEMLETIGLEIHRRREELGDLLAREEGKTLREAVGEVTRAAQIFKFFSGEVVRQSGEKLESIRPGVEVDITREPVGIVAVITPWNFPIAIPSWKIAPALAYGNCVVFKPSEVTPGCAWELADIIARAKVPAGVFNLVMGRGAALGSALVRSPGINAISFTGSVATGRQVLAAAVETGAKVQLEMGGKNPLVVLDDADLAQAVEVAVDGAFYSTGQRCTASSRFIVTKGIYPRFIEAMTAAIGALKIDDARKAGTQVGPVVSQSQIEIDLSGIARARAEGARVAVGGERLKRATEGFYLSPALLTETTNDHWINREEVFGPVATVQVADNYEHAVVLANDTGLGLAAGICTQSLKCAHDFRRRAQAGMVMVNLPTAGVDYHVPFGGRKGSSYGPREQGRYAREFYTTVKTAYTRA